MIDLIGDLDIDLFMSCFADDTKISYPINSIEDAEYFQECLVKLDTWQTENNMKFNNEKFKLLQFGKNENLKEAYTYLSPDCLM